MTEKEVLDRLTEIEQSAQDLLAQTARKKAELQKQADERTAAFDAETDAASKRELESLRETLEAKLDAQLKQLKEDTQKAMDFMESHYEQELEKRSDEIVSEILS